MADWQIVARVAGGRRFRPDAAGQWHGPNGEVYLDLAGLEEARGPSVPAEVANVHELVAELQLTAQACDRLIADLDAAVADLADTRIRLARAWKALRLAGRVVAGEPRRCPDHGSQFTRHTCCAHPQLVSLALAAIAEAMPRPQPGPEPTDPRGNQPTPAGVGTNIEKEH